MTRLSGIAVMMLYGETPSWQMHVSALMVADPSAAAGGFDAARFKSLVGQRLELAPAFRWKVRETAFGLDQPLLVDDGDFDLDRHFHHVAVPKPGDARQLGRLVGSLMAQPLDRSRPLWQMWLIEGLEAGRFATLTKVHHALIDGASGIDLTATLMDLDPLTEARPVPAFAPPDPPPSTLATAVGATCRVVGTPLRAARYAVQLAEQGAVAGRRLVQGNAAGLPFRTGRSSLNGQLTAGRDFAFVELPLDAAVAIKNAYGVKVNDVILAVVAGALRSYLLERDDLPSRSLVAEMPVNIRTEEARFELGTKVANAFVTLATDIPDPVERLRTIHQSSTDAKTIQQDIGAHKRLNLSDVLPPVLVGTALRAYQASGLETRVPPIYSVIVSNVRGPDLDLYLAGSKVVGMYPMGPLLYASGLNITALTLRDRIHFGLVTCPDVVEDPWAVAGLIPKALDQLTSAV
jgi:diacylglycerol O-acyltransferase / wax synthase